MYSAETLKEIALKFVGEDFDLSELNDHIEIIEDKTITLGHGCVFYYNSARFLKTKEFASMLMGNSPVFVDFNSGEASYIRGDIDVQKAVELIRTV